MLNLKLIFVMSFRGVIGAFVFVLWLMCTHVAVMAGLVGVDRNVPIRDWAFEQLGANRDLFAEASQLYADGKLDECRNRLAKMRASKPELPHPDLVIVWLQLSDQKLADAKSSLERLAATMPRDPQVALTCGQIALAESRLADAAAQLERTSLLRLPEQWSQEQSKSFAKVTLDTLALVYERQSRWMDAKTVLATLVGLDHDSQYAHRLARAHYNLGELEEAKALLKKVSQQGSATLPIPLLLADMAYSSGNFSDAEASIREALKMEPGNPEVQLWFAEWSLVNNQTDAALEALGRASRAGMTSARYWLSMGQCLMIQARYAEASTAFRNAIQSLSNGQPHHLAIATNLLAISLICQHDLDEQARQEAVDIAEKNALAYSTDPTYVGSLGWIYFRLDRLAVAEPLLRRAIELSPRPTSDLSFFMADFLSRTGDTKTARILLKASLEGTQGIFVMRPLAVELAKGALNTGE